MMIRVNNPIRCLLMNIQAAPFLLGRPEIKSRYVNLLFGSSAVIEIFSLDP
jgi:hypothetical protein